MVAFVIDTVIGFGVFWGLVVALGTEVGRRAGTVITMRFDLVQGEAYGELMGTVYHLNGNAVAVVILAAMAYWIGVFVVLQGLTGRTVGKALVRICAVDAAGRPCGIGRAAVRWLLLVVDAFPYLLPMLVGFIVTASSRTRQRVGDRVAGTWVVSADSLGEPIPDAVAPARPTRAREDELPPPDWP